MTALAYFRFFISFNYFCFFLPFCPKNLSFPFSPLLKNRLHHLVHSFPSPFQCSLFPLSVFLSSNRRSDRRLKAKQSKCLIHKDSDLRGWNCVIQDLHLLSLRKKKETDRCRRSRTEAGSRSISEAF